MNAMRELQHYINTSKKDQDKSQYCLLAQLYQMPEQVKPCIIETTPAFGTWQDQMEACNLGDITLGDILVM